MRDVAHHGRISHPARLWRSPEPKSSYDAVVVGAGGHGLATAFYLAAKHGITDVAVLERGWLGGGNVARNTAIVRSNYLLDETTAIYESALRLWEGLAEELDYDLLFDQRGVLTLAHNLSDVRSGRRHCEANAANGVDSEWLSRAEVAEYCPILDVSDQVRYPILGGALQRRGGIAKHDHVAWAYARAADALGVDLIQGCEVGSILVEGGRAVGVETSLGRIAAGRVGLATAGRTSTLLDTVGMRYPLQSRPLQALVSQLLEPVLDCVVMSNAVHVYVSQAHKGELVMGAGTDAHVSYAQRGSFGVVERQMAAALELFPVFAGAHVLRTWAGIVDVTPDASPIIGPSAIEGLYVNCGWGTGGFKATPAAGVVFAETMATGAAPELARPFAVERFSTGALVDEHAAAGVAH